MAYDITHVKTIQYILLALITISIIVGCSDPFPEIAVNDSLTYTQTQTVDYLKSQATKHGAKIAIYAPDRAYVAISYSDLEAYTNWFTNKTSFRHYEAEKRDCEDFANLYKSIMPFLCKDPAPAGLAVAVIAVRLPEPHALNAVLTEKGIYIIEPQNGQITHLDNYEFASKIYRIDL